MSELRAGWKTAKLSDENLFAFESGLWTGKMPPFVDCAVVRNTNFTDDGQFDFADVATIPIEERQLARKKLQRGDIIIERSGGGPNQPVGRVALFDLDDREFCFSNFTARLRVADRRAIEPYYLHLFLLAFHWAGKTEPLQRRTTGIRNLAFGDYKATEIAFPPLSEQRAIVATLRAVQEARAARRRELAAERERKAALMEDLFTVGVRGEARKETEIGPLPQGWTVAPLGSVAQVSSGGTPDRKNPEYWSGSVPWVKTGEINYNTIYDTEERITDLGLKNSSARVLPAGTLLMAMYGQGVTRGRVALLGIDAAINQACAALQFDMNQVDSQFAFHYLAKAYNAIRNLGHGANQTNLNASHIKSFSIPLPPLDEQKDIAVALTACDGKIAALEAEAARHDELYRALLEELISGRVSTRALINGAASEGNPA